MAPAPPLLQPPRLPPPAQALWPLLGVTLLAATVEASLAGVAPVPGTLLTAAGRWCGLAGLGLWVASLFLMLRPASLERACGGLDRLYFLHHATGVVAYGLLLAHPLLLAAAGGRGDAARALLLTTQPALLAGWASLLLLMVVLAATFWLPLPYARWRQVHVLTAPAFLLGGLHGLELAPPPEWAYQGLVGGGLAAGLGALAFRYLLHAGRVRAQPYRVAGVRHPTADTTELLLRPESDPIHWQPGQFVFAAFADGRRFRGCGEFHPFTIASAERPDGRLTLVVKSLGDCTRNIQGVESGVPVRLQGPFGGFLHAARATRPQLWIAGGIGITPFLAAAEALPHDTAPVDLLHFHRAPPAPCQQRLAALAARHRGLRLHELTGDPTPEAAWEWLRGRVPDLVRRQVFLCGPPSLVEALESRLAHAGVPRHEIHSERFDFR